MIGIDSTPRAHKKEGCKNVIAAKVKG
jgi:hypothetical protein